MNNSVLNLKGKTIVFVEDDLSSIRYYEAILKITGADIKAFNTGKAFVDYIEKESGIIDMVFMDFLIPLINGIECLRIFRKDRKSTPVIMITAYASEQTKTEAYIAGVDDYILKPIYPEKIYAILGKYFKSDISVKLKS